CPSVPPPHKHRTAQAGWEAGCQVLANAARRWQDESHPRLRFFVSNPYSLISLQRLRFDRAHSDFSHCPIGGCAVIDAQRPSCPTKSPKRFSASPGLLKPRSISDLILCCVAGRAIEATQASHPDSISISGGKLATLTRRLVWVIVCLSKEATRVASASTNPSRSASGNDLFT